jgi:uncharacterized protein YdaU (DUF1376 family)
MASPWFPLFGRDFLASTLGWTAEERGHYVTLLVCQWEQDGLPADPKRLELMSPGLSKCWKTIEPKFPISRGGKRRNPRLEHERHQANERSEKARQSASARWQKGTAPEAPVEAPAPEANLDNSAQNEVSGCERICDRTCDGICDGICSGDASMTTYYSPPPPPSPVGILETEGERQAWDRLQGAWNAAWGEKRRWGSVDPPPEAIGLLRDPRRLEEAIAAIPQIKAGACSGFDSPPTLRQFVAVDEKGLSFVARMLGGEFRDKSLQRKRREVPA